MIIFLLALVLKHPVPVCYGGFALVYLSLALLSRRDPTDAAAYGTGVVLAIALAVCAALAQ